MCLRRVYGTVSMQAASAAMLRQSDVVSPARAQHLTMIRHRMLHVRRQESKKTQLKGWWPLLSVLVRPQYVLGDVLCRGLSGPLLE